MIILLYKKIEELKRQIEILEQAIKNNDTNSEIESPELSEEDVKRWTKSEEELKADNIGGSDGIIFWVFFNSGSFNTICSNLWNIII